MRLYHTQSHCWVFIKQSDRPDYQDLLVPGLASRIARASRSLSPREQDPRFEKHEEATLLPKLGVYFAEFPNLPSPAVP